MRRVLTPLSWVYAGAVRARLWGYERGWKRVHTLGRPVISVGNVTAGWTGKTPLVIAIGEALLARGVGVTVLSRGYRGRAERAGALASDGQGSAAPTWEDVGDEPALIAGRLPGAAVIVGANRVAAWRRFAAALPAGVVILDDGFQHLAIAREENLVLWDATEPVDRSALLPWGRRRAACGSSEKTSRFFSRDSSRAAWSRWPPGRRSRSVAWTRSGCWPQPEWVASNRSPP